MERPIVKPTERVRQGRTGVGVRYVLLVGLVLVVVAFALVYAFHVL